MGRKPGKVKLDEEGKKKRKKHYQYNKAAYSANQLKRYYVERLKDKDEDGEGFYNNNDYFTDNFIYGAF